MNKTSDVLLYKTDNPKISYKRYIVNSHVPMHTHDFYEMEMIEQGAGTHILNGTEYPICAGSIYIIRPSDMHELIITEAATIRLIQIPYDKLSNDIFYLFSVAPSDLIASISDALKEKLFYLCNILGAEEDNYTEMLSRSLVSSVILLFMRELMPVLPEKNITANERLTEIISYIQGYFADDISIDSIASKFHYNPHYLCTYFKKNTGLSLGVYIRNLRLSEASVLVTTTKLSSTEVCERCGYGSISNFLRDFKCRYGVSPTTARKNCLERKEETE